MEAKERAGRELYETDALKITLPWVVSEVEETRALMGTDFWPYGVEPNRTTLGALTQYLVEQGLAERAPPAGGAIRTQHPGLVPPIKAA